MNTHTAAPTPEQVDFLLKFLEKYTPLARGYLRSAQNRAKGKKLWVELTRKLNALGGAQKSTKQWQKIVTEEVSLKPEKNNLKTEEDSLESIVTEEVCLNTEEDSFRTEEDSLESEAESLETDRAFAVSPAPGPQRRQRVHQREASQEGDFRGRLFRVEEARLAAEELQARELGFIRRSLDTLVNLLQTYMHRQ